MYDTIAYIKIVDIKKEIQVKYGDQRHDFPLWEVHITKKNFLPKQPMHQPCPNHNFQLLQEQRML